jgi:hypothetical protein
MTSINLYVSQTPNPAYLGASTNSVDVDFSATVTGGTPPFHWYWAFLEDEYTGIPPVGGVSVETENNSSSQQNLGTKTYDAAGNYPIFVNVIDYNGCVVNRTRKTEVISPTECITDLVRTDDD